MQKKVWMWLRCLVLALFSAQALADAALRHFDIPAQPTAQALNEFARQADITLVFSINAVAPHQSEALRGDYPVLEALRRLLNGTGLSISQLGASSIAVSASPPAPHPVDGGGHAPEAPGTPPTTHQDKEDDMNRPGLFRRIAALVTFSGAALSGAHAYAQDTAASAPPADASAANTSTLDEIVVTGSPVSKGTRKLDASYEITTASLEEIRDINPSSAADLLKIVPGVWAESSGGQSGANIELAGFPGGGDAPYVTYAINGSPIFPSSGNISFMDNSSLFRLDETIERAEVLQGGPGVLFGNGQMGVTANFILRQGTDTPHGDVGVTVGTEGLYRLDAFYGGPLAQDWFMSIGGFYRYSAGIRDSQFPADEGGQVTATLSHKFENGSVMFYVRALNDKNLFVTDIPVTVTGTGNNQSISAFPGFNPNTGTFAGNGLRSISVQETPTGSPVSADLADGRGADIRTFGSTFDVTIRDGVQLSNKLQYTSGDVTCNCLFNNTSPQTLGSFISSEITTVNGNAAITGPYGAASSGSGKLVSSGTAVNPASFVASVGFWIVQKHIQSFTDDLRFTFDLFEGNQLTTGGYLAAYSSNDHWWLGNNELITASPNAQLIDVTLNNGVNVTSPAGLQGGSFFTLNEDWNGLNTAVFLSDQWKWNSLLFDAGYRIEREKDHGTIGNDSSVDLDADPRNLYNKGVSVPNGTYNAGVSCETSGSNECTDYSHTLGSWTVGGNYEITPHMASFARITEGIHFPGFDDLRSGTPQNQMMKNYEVGYRVQTHQFYGVIDLFHRSFYGVPFQQFAADGSNITATYGANATGVNLETRIEPIEHFSVELTGDWVHSTYQHFSSVDVTGTTYDGLILQRQPRLQFRVTPQYELPLPGVDLRVFMTYQHVGLRYSDIANQQVLPAYYTLDAGLVAQLGEHFEIRLQGTNLTNQIGLTEGNARIALGTGAGISTNFEMARPIFGREGNVQLRYKF